MAVRIIGQGPKKSTKGEGLRELPSNKESLGSDWLASSCILFYSGFLCRRIWLALGHWITLVASIPFTF